MAVKISSFDVNTTSNSSTLKNLFTDLKNKQIVSSYHPVFSKKNIYSFKNSIKKNILKKNFLFATKSSIVVSRIGNVSRTTKGGRRRQVSVHGVEIGNGPWTSYASRVKAKSSQRFMALEKVSCPSTTRVNRIRNLEKMRTIGLNGEQKFTKSRNSGDKKNQKSFNIFNQRLCAANITFFSKDSFSVLPMKPMVTSAKGTRTILGFGSYRCDTKAEPIQYSALSLLGIKYGFVKNHGSKNGITRVCNMITSLKHIYPTIDRTRKFGIDPLKSTFTA